MKILEVVPVFSDPFGGPVTIVRSISKELAKRHEVVVYTTTALDPKHDGTPYEQEVNGYRVIYFKRVFKPLSYAGLFGQLNLSCDMMQAVKQNLREFDIVHVHSWQQFPDILVHHYATKYGIPYVLQVHGSLSKTMTKQGLRQAFDVFFGHKLLKDASMVIALSQKEVEQYKYAKVPDKKIATVPNALTLSEYANLPLRGSFKRKFGIQNDEKIMLYLGRIHETKGIDLLISAYAYLIKNLKCAHTILLVAGPDDGYLARAKELARSSGVSGSVLFTGFISRQDKISALVDADLFVTPSFYGFPLTFLEACGTGTPIVTTTLGDRLDWIDNNVGYVTSPTESDLAKVLYSLLADDDLREKFSINCRRVVNSEFSIGTVVDKLEQVYVRVLRAKQRGSKHSD
jgi:glycosyltransferase involved in cell wall biosynthesis